MPRRIARGGRAAAALVLVASLGGGQTLAADADEQRARVPLDLNFSLTERVVAAGVAASGIFALAAAPRLFDPPPPSFGPPAPGSYDRRISDALYSGDPSGSRFMWRIPDAAGLYVLPYLPALYYGFETAWLHRTGQTFRPGGDVNPDHRLWAYVEAIGWTALLTGVTKVLVGRDRPYVVLDHPELASSSTAEYRVSFFSSHSSATFCAASFVALDVSDRLRSGPLRGASGVRRFLLGTLAPYAAAFGVAGLVGFSRIVDQQHWTSDVVVGATLGTLVAHLAYVIHFDSDGEPRHRLSRPSNLSLVPSPSGLALAGFLP